MKMGASYEVGCYVMLCLKITVIVETISAVKCVL